MRTLQVITLLVCFVLGSCQTQPDISVTLGDSRTIPPDFVGYNGNLSQYDAPWSEPALVEAFQKLHPGTLRYPAGTLGNYWDWDRGWLADDVPDSLMIRWVVQQNLPASSRRYTLENLAEMYRQTGVDVVFMLNMLTRDLDHSLRNLRRARDLGIPIKYIELGNEFYFNLPLETSVFPTPESYGQACAEWMAVLKPEFPDAQFAVVAGGPRRSPRHERWDERVLAHAGNADAITIHIYTPSGLNQPDTLDVGPEVRQQMILDPLRSGASYPKLIATAHEAANRWVGHPVPAGGEIWITEWNLRGDDDPVRGSWANALFDAVFYHQFLDGNLVTRAHYHNLVGSLFEAIYTDESGLEHVLVDSLTTTPWTVSAGGLVGLLFGQAMTGQTYATRMQFETPESISFEGNRFPALAGWLFGTEELYTTGLLINWGSNSAHLDLSNIEALKRGYFRSFHDSLDAYVLGIEKYANEPDRLEPHIELPPFSLTLLTLTDPSS